MTAGETMQRSAVISECGLYRYELRRTWSEKPPLLLCGLNPSTADGERDDPTMRKEVGFARRLGAGGVVKINIYPYRATDWKRLRDLIRGGGDPFGDHDAHITRILDEDVHGTVIAAWGAHIASLPGGTDAANRMMARLTSTGPVHCFGRSADGHPRHTLMLAYSTPLVPYP